jgi:hypothetical protein
MNTKEWTNKLGNICIAPQFGRINSVLFNCHKKKVVGLERGPLSLVSTTVELLDRKVAAPV